jgi:hypothetical protein
LYLRAGFLPAHPQEASCSSRKLYFSEQHRQDRHPYRNAVSRLAKVGGIWKCIDISRNFPHAGEWMHDDGLCALCKRFVDNVFQFQTFILFGTLKTLFLNAGDVENVCPLSIFKIISSMSSGGS